MVDIIGLCVGAIFRPFCTRQSLVLEIRALRQQLAVLKPKRPRPKLAGFDVTIGLSEPKRVVQKPYARTSSLV